VVKKLNSSVAVSKIMKF